MGVRPGTRSKGNTGQPKARRRRRVSEAAAVPVARVQHYFPRCGAAILHLCGDLRRGDLILVRGQTTDFLQRVEQLQRGGKEVATATAEDEVGLATEQVVRPGDRVYRLCF